MEQAAERNNAVEGNPAAPASFRTERPRRRRLAPGMAGVL